MIFSHLELEEKVQVKDKTRFNAFKTFVSKGGAALTTMTLKPGAEVSAQNIFDAVVKNRFLDWQFAAMTFDIDSSNNKIDFKEGGSQLTATLTTGTYTLAQLANEIALQMNAVGGQVYTASYDTKDKLTISAPGVFTLLPESGTNKSVGILPHVGFPFDSESPSISQEGLRTEYGIKQITLVAGDGTTTDTRVDYIKVYSVEGDALFSSDKDMMIHEPEILKWVKEGRNSFMDVHRRSQSLILDFLDNNQIYDSKGDRITKAHIVDLQEVKEWSTFMSLRLIFEGNRNASDDVLQAKAKDYESREQQARDRWLKLDYNKDGKANTSERLKVTSSRMIRE